MRIPCFLPVCAPFSLSRRPSRGVKKKGGDGKKARVTAISRLKSRRCYVWSLELEEGRGWNASIRGGETSIPFQPGMQEDEDKKTPRRVFPVKRKRADFFFFFAIPRRLFRILIKPGRGKGWRTKAEGWQLAD